jgi:N-methylhydantoinase A
MDAPVEDAISEMEAAAREEFEREGLEGVSHRSLDLRYRGQGYELNVPFGTDSAAAFHELHRRRYGFADTSRAIEIVNMRVRMLAPAPLFEQPRESLREGDGSPAIVGTRQVIFEGEVIGTRIYERDRLRAGDTFAGPAIVSEYSSATILPPGDVLRVDELGNLVIEVHA